MPQTENLQQQAIEAYKNLSTKKGQVGQFKQIIPITEDKAIAVVKASKGDTAKTDLQHEINMLNQLREKGLPGLQTYGDVFEIVKEQYAVVMDWIPEANLIDGKSPDILKFLIPALMLNVPINTGEEGWVLKIAQVRQQILSKSATADITQVQDFAKTLSEQIGDLIIKMEKENVLIGDLQILVAKDGKITIIDPLDILKFEPNNATNPQAPENFVDINHPDKPSSTGFVRSLMQSVGMLHYVKDTCTEIARIENHEQLKHAIHSVLNGLPQQSRSAPVSPVMERVAVPRQSRSAPPSPTPAQNVKDFQRPAAILPARRQVADNVNLPQRPQITAHESRTNKLPSASETRPQAHLVAPSQAVGAQSSSSPPIEPAKKRSRLTKDNNAINVEPEKTSSPQVPKIK